MATATANKRKITAAPMLAYHGDPRIKEKYLARVVAHRKADELVKGRYWENGKGCAVGCTIHGSSHAAYETELGIPRVLARLEDVMFERMENVKSKMWPERFLQAIAPGADLSLVWPRFAVWTLIDPVDGVIRFSEKRKTTIAIESVAALWQRAIDGESVESLQKDFATAAAAASAAYANAANAYAAAYAAAGNARKIQWGKISNKLIRLLKECPA